MSETRRSGLAVAGFVPGTLAGVVAFILTLQFSYLSYVVPSFEYWGFGGHPVAGSSTLLAWGLGIAPVFMLRDRIERPSEFLVVLQYLVIYVPTLFILDRSQNPVLAPGETVTISLALFVGMVILILGTRLPPMKLGRPAIPPWIFWTTFWACAALLGAYLITTLGGSFRLVSLGEIYSVRKATSEAIEEGGFGFAGYALMWLAGFFLPLGFAVGAQRRRPLWMALVVAGYVLAFGLAGSKQTLFALGYLGAIFFWTRFVPQRRLAWLAVGFAMMLLVPGLLQLLGPAGELVGRWYTLIVNVRIFGIPQLSIAQYYDFFASNPLTYGSHIKGVDVLVAYPYAKDVPFTVGEYFYGRPIGANVGMWAQDGIASFGILGVILVSLVAATVFWVLDSVSVELDTRMVIVSLGVIATSLTNVSLFTTLLSGGLLLAIVSLWLMPREHDALVAPPGHA